MFNTKEEFILALMEGRKFKRLNGTTIWYDNKHLYPFRTSSRERALRNFDVYPTVTEVFTNWYDNPANVGKLCWCWDDHDEDLVILSTFSSYITSGTMYPMSLICGSYRYAKLLTPEELAVLGGIEQIKNT